jgi:predicted GNAT family acetyltransferase
MTDTALDIRHEDQPNRGAFFIERDGKRIAEQTYKRSRPDHITVDHTFVDDSLRGQGVARKLLDTLVAWARKTGTRVSATCTYAKKQFEQDASLSDIYDP